MNSLRTITPAIFLLACVVFTGCIGQPALDNNMNIQSANASMFTPKITTSLTQCLPKMNTTLWVRINPVNDHHIGDVFEISGSTNFDNNYNLSYWISRQPLRLRLPSEIYEIRGFVKSQNRDCDFNIWSFLVNTSELGGGNYNVVVGDENMTISDWKMFNLQ